MSPALKISMKSLRNGAPEFPPPPNTWLITTLSTRTPAIATEAALLRTPSASMISDPCPRRSAPVATPRDLVEPGESCGAIVSTIVARSLIVTECFSHV